MEFLYSSGPEQTVELAQKLGIELKAGDALVLSGNLGAGKTLFSTVLLNELGLSGEAHSPTFTLVNVHQTPRFPVYHADFYRLESEEELWAAGWEDYLDGRGVLVIEWGERFTGALPDDYLWLTLEQTGPNTRRISVQSTGPRSEQIKEAWASALVGS